MLRRMDPGDPLAQTDDIAEGADPLADPHEPAKIGKESCLLEPDVDPKVGRHSMEGQAHDITKSRAPVKHFIERLPESWRDRRRRNRMDDPVEGRPVDIRPEGLQSVLLASVLLHGLQRLVCLQTFGLAESQVLFNH